MKDFFAESVFWGVFISIISYEIGIWMKKKFKMAVFNPLLTAIFLTMGFLLVFDIEYEVYEQSARYLSYFLTPVTVALAVPLYEQIEPLRKNWQGILAGIFAGAITSAVCVLVLSVLMGLNHQQYVTLLPKSITTAIGMSVSKELGGIVTITVAVIVITGVLGNVIAETVYRIFKITEPIAVGVGLGSSSHALGTAKALEMGELQGAMSSLSIAVSGLMTVVIANVFAQFY